jgi:hypothetical protein
MMLSVKELNEILQKLIDKEEIPMIGTFSEVDIIFVAGLFLWYKQHEESWKRISVCFKLTDNENAWNHSHYFKQIEEIYGTKHHQIFDKFPNASSAIANTSSDFFAPPIYITERNIDVFFGDRKNENIENIKNKYIKRFDILDFVDIRSKHFSDEKRNEIFHKYEIEIKKRLEKYPPIFTFVFIVASKKLAKKRNETLYKRKDYIEKLWFFTQDYVRGLYELSKNIVEHSGQKGLKGEGMITIRAYSESETDRTKILETHVFDYGEKGIVAKLVENTKEKATGHNAKNERIRDCYLADDAFFAENRSYELKDLIAPSKGKELKQQLFRHTSHYGINKLYKLVQNPLNGEMLVASKGRNKRDYFGENAEKWTLNIGTHYYFKIPFVQENFKNIVAKPFPQENQTATLGETSSLEFLSKLEYKEINLNQLSDIPHTTENSLIDITIENEEITKENVDKIYYSLDRLLDLKDNNRIAINLQSKINDVSVLLRFLSFLTFEYKQPFIIYNINYHIYKELLEDNKDFYLTRYGEAYWHNEQALLLFVKADKGFYFADILFGRSREEFLFVNNIVSKTFPNTITLLQEIDNKKKGGGTNYLSNINSNQNLQQFFYPKSNNLLPFDALIKNQEVDNPLFLSNLSAILQNPLFNRANSYSNLNEYIENFDGFLITNTHFKIGTKIHSEDFYYAKRLFQNSFYTARLAMLLAIRIKEKIGDTNQKITLIGYELYSELLLSLIEKFLKDLGFKKENEEGTVNHFITQSDEDKFKFLPSQTFKKYLEDYKNRCSLIIVPIASTGSTATKIENDIRKQIRIYEKETNKKSEQHAKEITDKYDFFKPHFNILLAQPENGFDSIKKTSENQIAIIKLSAKWHEIKDCLFCYGGNDKNGKKIKTKTLFETDKSSLTPALIFGKPEGKVKSAVGNEVESNIPFDDLNFEDSLKYKKVFRNDTYRIYYIETDKFIEKNLPTIKKWLNNIVRAHLNLDAADKIAIVAPCHESNSQFINLVNEVVFFSSATIIHYQNNVDFAENFTLLNRGYLSNGVKIFFVDDSLITGKHFYEVFDLVKDVIKEPLPFTASIFLNDKSVPLTHNKIVELSNIFFAFANLNQPPALNLLEQRPLEHERQRYEALSKTALHDVTIRTFQDKADSLNPPKMNETEENKKDKEKESRRIKCLEATHKIYDYFARNTQDNDYEIDKIVNFRRSINTTLFPEFEEEKNREENKKALLKVLSQYPFILYHPLREKTFNWLEKWLTEIEIPNKNCFVKTDYDNFQTMKFLLRRASLLGNYQVLEKAFFQKILFWFIKIDKYFIENKPKLSDYEENNLQDFPIFVLRNYIEMIQKNGWVAYHILMNMRDLKCDFLESKQGSQFFCMLQMESALIIDDFCEMITKEKRLEWRDIFKYADGEKQTPESKRRFNTEFIDKTDRIVNFFIDDNPQFLDTNKFLVVKEAFLKNSDDWLRPQTPFINYLWIRQLLFVDCIDKDSHFPQGVDYQRKIDAIIEKMKGIFYKKQVRIFFVVTDGQQTPHILKEAECVLNNFNEEFDTDKKINVLSKEIDRLKKRKNNFTKEEITNLENKINDQEKLKIEKKKHKTQTLIDFLNGTKYNTRLASETTAEYYRDCSEKEIQEEFNKNFENASNEAINQDLFSNPKPNLNLAKWTNAYNKESTDLPFMPSDSKWLFLIRITKRNEHNEEFDALGLLGFYSHENQYNAPENLFSEQLLMLLRRDLGRFIEKHHKNEEFAGLIQQKERNKYVFRLNHGVSTYKDAIEAILDNCENTDLKNDLNIYFDYLITKLEIINKLSSETEIELISLDDIKTEFINRYKSVLCLNVNGIKGFKKEHISSLVKISFMGFENNNERYYFPKNSIKDIVFELLNNIRKNVRDMDTFLITPETPLIIIVSIVEEFGKKYLSIANNHVRNLDKSYPEEDIPHGIDLLRQMWSKHDLGKIITPNYPLKENSFTIKLQLTTGE